MAGFLSVLLSFSYLQAGFFCCRMGVFSVCVCVSCQGHFCVCVSVFVFIHGRGEIKWGHMDGNPFYSERIEKHSTLHTLLERGFSLDLYLLCVWCVMSLACLLLLMSMLSIGWCRKVKEGRKRHSSFDRLFRNVCQLAKFLYSWFSHSSYPGVLRGRLAMFPFISFSISLSFCSDSWLKLRGC